MIGECENEQLGENVHWVDAISVVGVVVESTTGHISLAFDKADMVLQWIDDAQFQDHSDNLIHEPSTANYHRKESISCK